MRYKIVLICVVTAMLVTTGLASAQEGTVGKPFTMEVVACPDSVVNGRGFNPSPQEMEILGLQGGEVEGETYDCGVIYVPENYAAPDGRIIELFYVRLRSTSKSPAPDPVIHLAGGPGGSGSGDVSGNPTVLANLNKLRQRRDIIGYDQRGTGYSNYLLCAPFLSTLGIVIDQLGDPKFAALVEDALADPQGEQALSAMICSTVYKAATDVDLAQYNSVASAQDILHLAEALGYSEGYNLYGASYGTRLAQFAMRGTPDQIRSVVIDGVVAPSIHNIITTFTKVSPAYLSIFEQCAADAACAAAYPDLTDRFAALLQKLEANPLVLDPPIVLHPAIVGNFDDNPILTQIDPAFFIALADFNDSNRDGGLAASVPYWIAALEADNPEPIIKKLSVAAPPPTEGPAVAPAASEPESPDVKQPLFELPFAALLTLAQQAASAVETGVDVQWVSIVLNDLEDRYLAGEDQDGLIASLVVLSVVPNKGTDAQALVDFADKHLSAQAAQAADALVGQMARGDVRRTMWTIQDIAMRLGAQESRFISHVMQRTVNCAEDVSFSSMEDAQAAADAAAYPELFVWPIEDNQLYLTQCAAYPSNLEESVTDPVVSDIPTLIFTEALDVHTPVTWGPAVADGLRNSYELVWPNMGHIAFGHDMQGACAGDIAAAFFDNPARQPNFDCAQSEKYKLHFVLPE